MVKRTASLQVIQRDARSSWSSTPLWTTRGVTDNAQDNSVLDNAFVLIDALSQVTPGTGAVHPVPASEEPTVPKPVQPVPQKRSATGTEQAG